MCEKLHSYGLQIQMREKLYSDGLQIQMREKLIFEQHEVIKIQQKVYQL